MEPRTLSAMAYYQQGYRCLSRPEACAPDPEKYYFTLRSILFSEIQKTGGSPLLWHILTLQRPLDALTYLVCLDILSRLEGGSFPSQAEDIQVLVQDSVRRSFSGLTGSASPVPVALPEAIRYVPLLCPFQQVQPKLQKLLRQAYLSFAPQAGTSREEEPRRSAEAALQEADRIRSQAQAVLDEARQQRDLFYKKRRELEDREIAGRSQARQQADQLLEQQLREQLDRERLDQQQYLLSLWDRHSAELLPLDRFHNDMCAKLNCLQANWTKALESMSRSFDDAKNELYTHLHTWQVGLYPADIRQLSQLYVDLYNYTNLDKTVSQELVLLKDDPSAEAQALLRRITRLNNTLSRILIKYETVLRDFGLTPFAPKPGDDYDDYWHLLYDGEAESGTSYEIEKCILPGVSRSSPEDPEGDVVIQAQVAIRPRRDSHE